MGDLKEFYRDMREHKRKARERMVVCDGCGLYNGRKTWPNSYCHNCDTWNGPNPEPKKEEAKLQPAKERR